MGIAEGDCFELFVNRLAAGGDGVGRAPSGITVFVPFTAPGDRVWVRVREVRRRFARAEAIEVIEASAQRTTPACGVFGRCGGCAWQHLEYASQLDAKAEILRDAFERVGGLALAEPPAMLASPEPYGYRSRARVIARDGKAGYRERRAHTLCGVEECPVLAPALRSVLAEIARGSAGDARLQEWEVAVGSDRVTHAHALGASGELGARTGVVPIRVGGDVLRFSMGGFAQSNHLLWEALHARVLTAAGEGERVLELYSGAGFFTVALTRRFGFVEAIESNQVAVADLEANLGGLDPATVRIHNGRVEHLVPAGVRPNPEVVLLDPPRVGIPAEVAAGIAELRPRCVVYLSCDPATLARDCARLHERGYRLRSVEGIDLFPQTPHLEALATLTLP